MGWSISVERAEGSKLSNVDWENLQFGRVFTDHMFIADFYDGAWRDARIVPFGDLCLSPAFSAIHYGQSIFEGMKAQRGKDGDVLLFRPNLNARRFNVSAQRMALPTIPEEDFINSIKALVDIEKSWIPNKENHSLYIRPFLFGNDSFIGVKPPDNAKFVIFCCPVGPYYSTPLKVMISEKYVRAVPGGAGFAKAAGNYGATLMPVKEIKEQGYDQYLWTDVFEHRYIQEVGTMNVFFVINEVVITPELDGTLLDGTTRDTLLHLFREQGTKVEERKVTVDEIYKAYKEGTLTECFGSGTAAVVSPINLLTSSHGDIVLKSDREDSVSRDIKKKLTEYKLGIRPDDHNWLVKF